VNVQPQLNRKLTKAAANIGNNLFNSCHVKNIAITASCECRKSNVMLWRFSYAWCCTCVEALASTHFPHVPAFQSLVITSKIY